MTTPPGQITPDSVFGQELTALAKQCEINVEIGTWEGGGSTLCLANGLEHGRQWLVSFEANLTMHQRAKMFWANHPKSHMVHLIWGHLLTVSEMLPYEGHPEFPLAGPSWYIEDQELLTETPYAFRLVPPEIDLLLLDGSQWSSAREWAKLQDRCRFIALDDCHPVRAIKNGKPYSAMKASTNWKLVKENLDDRYGWAIFERR